MKQKLKRRIVFPVINLVKILQSILYTIKHQKTAMKYNVITLFLLMIIVFNNTYSQKDETIARTFFQKSEDAYNRGKYEKAKEYILKTKEHLAKTNIDIMYLEGKIRLETDVDISTGKSLFNEFLNLTDRDSDSRYKEVAGYIVFIETSGKYDEDGFLNEDYVPVKKTKRVEIKSNTDRPNLTKPKLSPKKKEVKAKTTYTKKKYVKKAYTPSVNTFYDRSFLLSMALPSAPFGIAYHSCDNFGYFASLKTDFNLGDGYRIVSAGIEKELSTYANIYLGVGYEFELGEPLLETGFLIKKNKLALDVGLGFINDDAVYFNLGIGFNF